MNQMEIYRRLATRLNELPHGFPPTDDGIELRLLSRLFTPAEAELAATLGPEPELPAQIAQRINIKDVSALREQLKTMAKKGLIATGRANGVLGYKLMPFVVGIYELHVDRLDIELARLFETYYQRAFKQVTSIAPAFHRVIPVYESVQVDMEIHPFESIAEIVANAKAWGVVDCICRKQKVLIGEPCEHPIDVCMTLSGRAGAFDSHPVVRALAQQEALATLHRAAQAGLVHTVSNTREGLSYICNCCTCSCGILRGIVEIGIANVIARSAFVNRVNEQTCVGCGECLSRCQFGALSLHDVVNVNEERCVGCGVCVSACLVRALSLVRRPDSEIEVIPVTEEDWRARRLANRSAHLSAASPK